VDIRRFVALTAVLIPLLTMGGPSLAHAARPEITKSEFIEVNAPVANCGSFTIIANYTGTIKTTLYFDAQGQPTRLLFQGRATGTLTNSVTGYSVKDAPSIANFTQDLVQGTFTRVGVDFHVTVPGAGVVILQAGRIVFDASGSPTFIAGPHLGPPAASTAALCAALNH
jgi:hypothetical protein